MDERTETEEERRLRGIEEELERVRSTTRFTEPDEGDLEARLREIESRARSARSRHERHQAERRSRSILDKEAGRGMGIGLTIAYAILGLPLLGFGLGLLADRQAGGTLWQAVGTLTGASMAVVYAVRVMNRA